MGGLAIGVDADVSAHDLMAECCPLLAFIGLSISVSSSSQVVEARGYRGTSFAWMVGMGSFDLTFCFEALITKIQLSPTSSSN